jgi:hypothetical protein
MRSDLERERQGIQRVEYRGGKEKGKG